MKHFAPPAILMLGLIAILFLSSCVTHKQRSFKPLNPYYSATLEYEHKKNFNRLKTDMAIKGLAMGTPIYIRAFKTEMEMELWGYDSYSKSFKHFKTYPICKKSGVLGPKQKEGDLQTPEGFYDVTYGRMNPNSKYYLSFDIGYPNAYDRSLGRTGSALMIHGNCVSEGCLAMTDKNIGEIYIILEESFKNGSPIVPIHLFPFRMTEQNMALRKDSEWMPFWMDLKHGYDYFEKYHFPPVMTHQEGKYALNLNTQ